MRESSRHGGSPYQFSIDIPDHYDETALRILPCNPSKLFVFWELPGQLRRESVKLHLKVAECNGDTGQDPSPVQTCELLPDATSYYIDLSFPGLSYTIELGRIVSDGSYETIRTVTYPSPHTVPAVPSATPVRRSAKTSADTGKTGTGPGTVHHSRLPDALPGFFSGSHPTSSGAPFQ